MDSFYTLIGNSRPFLGRITAILFPFRQNYNPLPRWAQVLCIALFVIALLCNFATLDPFKEHLPTQTIFKVARYAQVFQRWNLFVPNPRHRNYSYKLTGQMSDDTLADLTTLYERGTITKHGTRISFQSHQWQKFYFESHSPKLRPAVIADLQLICKNYNTALKDGRPRIISLTLNLYMTQEWPNITSDFFSALEQEVKCSP